MSLFKEEYSGITSDSRDVKPGFIFVATKGTSQDGHRFLEDADKSGATLLVGSEPKSSFSEGIQKKYIEVKNSQKELGILAGEFYGSPSLKLRIIGVTGTCGKTTTTFLLEAILKAAGEKVGVIGTVNFRTHLRVLPSTHTTPGAVELQKLLSEMLSDGVTAVIMEVSSHALKQFRVAGVYFDGVGFLNLTPEHLDFHPDMEDYFQSKKMLFTEYFTDSILVGKTPKSTLFVKDEFGVRLNQELQNQNGLRSYAFSTQSLPSNVLVPSQSHVSVNGIELEIENTQIQSDLIGKFNINNILVAFGIAKNLGIKTEHIQTGIRSLKKAHGRLESVPNEKDITVLVDYAHKPDALDNVLSTLSEIKASGRLITVFGCGGDRDRLKRPVMGKMSVLKSDFVYVTSDNPRTENPDSIIDQIVVGIKETRKSNYEVLRDRGLAIQKAVKTAKAGDIVLIAGKGHEDYQILADPADPKKTIKIHFDDREEALKALNL